MMSAETRLGIVAVLLVAVTVTLAIKRSQRDVATPPTQAPTSAEATLSPPTAETRPAEVRGIEARLPRLVDLGADKCIPCKKMAPILDELRREFAGRLEVEFIDVWKNERAGDLYKVRLIPTQIFFDASGKELFRHEGFYSREDILAKWKELGVTLEGRAAAP